MRFYKCDFCNYHTGLHKPINPKCEKCYLGSNFSVKTNMTPQQAIKWKSHNNLDIFIESLGCEVVFWQRLYLHQLLDTPKKFEKTIYCRIPKYQGLNLMYSLFITSELLLKSKNKEKKDESN